MLGAELAEFLVAKRISAICCVPTLLATLDEDIPGLRFLLVSGEACPRDLILRWHRPGRRFLNVYGPTEATVTATFSVVDPTHPVTLGIPLPSYAVVILDPSKPLALPVGTLGEIGLAGIGLAKGYVKRDDLTDKAFISDFLEIENNPSGRIYRTGDLGRINAAGEIEYFGRIDTQVKIRGYRIELTEIESVLLQVPGVAQAVVDTYESSPGVLELVAYYSLRNDTEELDKAALRAHLQDRLPGYMVPAYLEELETIPLLPSHKADRKKLPPPTSQRSSTGTGTEEYTAPATETEELLAAAMAEVLGVAQVSTKANFFTDLGANSLLLAHFCSSTRKNTSLPALAMRDIYQNPTIESLAGVLETTRPAAVQPVMFPEPAENVWASTRQFVTCGVMQLLIFLGYTYLTVTLMVVGYQWAAAAPDVLQTWLRSLAFGWNSWGVHRPTSTRFRRMGTTESPMNVIQPKAKERSQVCSTSVPRPPLVTDDHEGDGEVGVAQENQQLHHAASDELAGAGPHVFRRLREHDWLHRRGPGGFQHPGQRFDRRVLVDVPHGQGRERSVFPGAGRNGPTTGIGAEVGEEVRLGGNLREPRTSAMAAASSSSVSVVGAVILGAGAGAGSLRGWRRQFFPVGLVAGQQRDGFQPLQVRRHHVAGQPMLAGAPAIRLVEFCGVVAQAVVGHELDHAGRGLVGVTTAWATPGT